MTVYTVALSKGGSTKTTTAAELVAELARRGRKVLAIDLDQQGNLTTRLGVTGETEVATVAALVLLGKSSATQEEATPAGSVPGAYVLAGTHHLADLDHRPEVITSLRDHIPQIAGEWDDIVIDTPPSLGLVTLAGLAAADVVVVSLECKTEAFDQLSRLKEVIAERLATRMRPGLAISWIVPTKHNGRRLLDREVIETLEELYPGQVTPPVREGIVAADAYTAGMPVSVYAPNAPVSRDYAAALEAILGSNDRQSYATAGEGR
jgi:chromosome partitioning protein